MSGYLVQRKFWAAWILIPDGDSSRMTWTNAKSDATVFHLKIVADGWAWSDDGIVVDAEQNENGAG